MHSFLNGHPALVYAIQRLEQLNPDQFEIYFEHRTSTRIDSKDQAIDSLSRSEDAGLAIRLIKDRRMGFSFTTSLEDHALRQAVNTAAEVASLMPEDENLGFHAFGRSVYPSVDNFDAKGLAVPLSQKIALALELEGLCRKADRRITGVRSASVSETIEEVHLVDSHGEHIHHKSTGYSASILCKAESGGDSQMGSEYSFSNDLESLPTSQVAQLSAQWAVELLGAKAAPTMNCPAILRNSVVSELLEFLSSSFSAEQVDKKRSILSGKEGQIIFSDQVTLTDDGLLPGGAGTAPFDAEGVPSQKTVLIDGGFLSGFLYDSYYAKKNDKEPTGTSVRGLKAPPSIGFSNLYLKKGKKQAQALLDGISRGVLITDLMGVHTANPVTGDFSLGASGFLIENGRLAYPVRGFAVAGNVLDLFRKVTDVGSDLKFFGRIGAPSVRLSDLSVGGE